MSDSLRIAVSVVDDTFVIALRGDWDLSNRQALHEAFLSVGTDRDVLVDLRSASFFDSSALGELIALYKRLTPEGRRVETLVGDSNMQRLLELTSLEGLLGISPERARYFAKRLSPAEPAGGYA